MKLSYKYHPKLTRKESEIIEELSFHTTKLYNTVNYNCRQDKFVNYVTMNTLYSNNWHKQFMHSHTYQQCLKLIEQNWKSFFAGVKDYAIHPEKYEAKPQPPKFKNSKNKNEVIFTNFAIRVMNNTIMLSLSKAMQDKFKVKSLNFNLSDKIKSLINLEGIQQIKIAWNKSSKKWYLNIIYEKEQVNITKHFDNIMSIDLGLDNLATITFENNIKSYLIDGKWIKCKNSYYNKSIAKFTSIKMKQDKEPEYFKRSKIINKLQEKRNNTVKDYIHKASRKIIDLAISNKCHTIIIGDFSGVKQNNTIKSFVQIPQQQLVDKVKYKADLVGIKIVLQEESYTSGCSALDLDIIGKKYYDKKRRVKRGLFVSNKGIKINADINGSINIMRKYLKCIPKSLKEIMDNGFVDNPLRLRVAY